MPNSKQKIAIIAALNLYLSAPKKNIKLWGLASRIESHQHQKISTRLQLQKYMQVGKLVLVFLTLVLGLGLDVKASENNLKVCLTSCNLNTLYYPLKPITVYNQQKPLIELNSDKCFGLTLTANKIFLNVYKVQSLANHDLPVKPIGNILLKLNPNDSFELKIKPNDLSRFPVLKINNKSYSGNFEIFGKLIARIKPVKLIALYTINNIELEEYVSFVVPCEMPSSWPIEALKAQAILARSYALANLGKYLKLGFDLKDNIEDQVYNGFIDINQNVAQASNLTRGIVLTYQGKVISSFYHSSAGGKTDLAKFVWNKDIPYLKSVDDFDDSSPFQSWNRKFSLNDLENVLYNKKSYIINLQLLSLTQSKRAHTIMVNANDNSLFLSGEQLRNLLHLPSSVFDICYDASNNLIFTGSGYGHGLGLSQWGAKALASKGYNVYDIIKYYYNDIRFQGLTMRPPLKASCEVVF